MSSQPDATPGELGSLVNRFLAAVIDGVIIAVPMSIILWPIVLTGMIPFFLYPLVGSALGFGIFGALNFKSLKSKGQTIGKGIMNLKIVQADGELMNVQDLLVKRYGILWLVCAIPYIGGLIAIGDCLLALRESRRAGHDELADTKVVNS